MVETTEFELVAPERLLIDKQVQMVVVPGAEGNIGVLPNHAPLLSTLRAGVIQVYERRPLVADRIFVAGGFVEVTPDRCTVLAEHAIPVDQLDGGTIQQEINDLLEDIADAKSDIERTAAERALGVAHAKNNALRS